MIGAPMKAYVNEIQEFLEAETRIPEFYGVGNAVGALMDNVIRRSKVLIRAADSNTDQYYIFSEIERKLANGYPEAVDYGIELIEKLIFEHMNEYGLQKEQIRFELERKDLNLNFGALKETQLMGLGIGNPLKLEQEIE